MKLKIIYLVTVLFISCATTSIIGTDKLWENLGAISYGTDSNQFIEITIPKNNSLSKNAILFLHGYQDRMADPSFIEKYRDDYIIGKLDYRHLTPERAELNMEELLLDLHNGLGSLKDTVEERGIIANKIILIGHSFGAWLSLMYSYTFLERSPIPIAFCVSLAGITDLNDAMIMQNIKNLRQGFIQNYILSIISIMSGFELSSNDITELGFSENAYFYLRNISPIQYVNGNSIPTIIVHDTKDNIIPFSNSVSLYNVLNIFQIPNIFIQSVTGAGHYFNNHIYRISNTVFTPLNSRLPVSNPRRITLNIHPLVERKLIESIDNFIIKFCQ